MCQNFHHMIVDWFAQEHNKWSCCSYFQSEDQFANYKTNVSPSDLCHMQIKYLVTYLGQKIHKAPIWDRKPLLKSHFVSCFQVSLDKYESHVFVLAVVARGLLIFRRLHCPEVTLLTRTHHTFKKCKLFLLINHLTIHVIIILFLFLDFILIVLQFWV